MSSNAQFLDNLFDEVINENYDLDNIMASDIYTDKSRGISTKHLSKIW